MNKAMDIELISFLRKYTQAHWARRGSKMGQDMLIIPVSLMISAMLCGQSNEESAKIGRNIPHKIQDLLPTGHTNFDKEFKKFNFNDLDDQKNREILLKEAKSHANPDSELNLGLDEGVLKNISLLYYHWESARDFSKFQALKRTWYASAIESEDAHHSFNLPSIIFELLDKVISVKKFQ